MADLDPVIGSEQGSIQYLLRNNVWSRDCARINESCGDLVFVTKLVDL